MTTVIDERVVEMRFNNADFEKNVAQSMKTLDSLKKSLNFDSVNAMSNLANISKGFSLAGVSETISEATTKFSALEIAGVTAIAKIASEATDFGIKFVKSLSIDQVSSGFQKYADKTSAVQTIIAATGKSIDEVEGQMEKLNWFTDETSYNFVDMSNNIGKFTSNGVELGKAASAMQGIAAWAARSGQNAEAASRAMYNVSQAIGAGAMKLQDWKSIENANMATMEFKQTAIDTAVELGRLKKSADGLVTTLDGKEAVTVKNFSETLKKKWFDSDVLVQTLNKYNSYAEELYALSEKTGRTATQLMMDADKYAQGSLKIEEISKSTGVSVEELSKAYESLNSEANELSKNAFKDAQAAKTFKDVMDATADAVSTSWMNTFQLIFGNFEEAKALWTGVANDLIGAFTAGGTLRNEILEFWRQGDIDGRTEAIKGLVNALNIVVKPLTAIKSALASMFPDAEGMGNVLKNVTVRFRELTERLQPSEQTLKDIYFIFKGLFTIGKLVINIFTGLVKAILPVTRPFGSLLEMIIHALGYIGAVITVIGDMINESNVLEAVISVLTFAFTNLGNILKVVATVIGGALATGVGLLATVIIKAVTAVTNFVKHSKVLSTVVTTLSNAFNKIISFFSKFRTATEKTTTVVKKMEENFSGANEVIAESGTITRDAANDMQKATTPLQKLISIVKSFANLFKSAASAIAAGFKTITTNVKNFGTEFVNRFKAADTGAKSFFDHIKSLFVAFGGLFGNIGEKIKGLFENIGVNTDALSEVFRKIGEGVKTFINALTDGRLAAIAFAAALLALVGAAIKVTESVSGLVDSVGGVFKNINKLIKGQFAKSTLITDLAKSFAILSASLALLTFVDQDALDNTAKVMLKLMGAFTGCAIAIRFFDTLFSKWSAKIKAPIVSANLLALAGTIAILVGSFYVLNKIDVREDWLKKVGIIGLMLLELSVAAGIVSRVAPKLSTGAILLLVMAKSMKVMADAMLEISGKDISNIENNIVGFSILFGAMAAMVAASGQIKLTSAASLLLVAKAFEIIFPRLIELINTMDGNGTFDSILDRVEGYIEHVKTFFRKMYDTLGFVGSVLASGAAITAVIGSLVLLTQFFKALGGIGKLLSGLGMAFAGIGVGIVLISKAMENIAAIRKNMSAEDFNQVAKVMAAFIGVMGAVVGIIQILSFAANLFNKKVLKSTDDLAFKFASIGAAFVGIGASMVLIASALKIASTIDKDKIVSVGIVIGVLMGVLAGVAAAAGTIKSGVAVIGSMIGIVSALAVLIAEIAVVSIMLEKANPVTLGLAFAGVLTLMAVLGLVVEGAGNVKSALPVLLMVIGVVGTVAAVGAALYALQEIPWDSFRGAVAAMSIVLMEVVGAVAILSMVATAFNISPNSAAGMIIIIGGILAALGTIGGILYALKGNHWEDLGGVVKAIGLVMLEMVVLGAAFSAIARIFKDDIKTTLALMIGTILSLVTVGGVLYLLSNITWEQFVPVLKSVGAVMGMMALFAASIGLVTKFLVGDNWATALVLLAGTIGALITVGIALGLLSKIPWEDLKGPMIALISVMATMTGLVTIIGLITKMLGDWKQIGGTLALMAGAIATLVVVGYSLAELSKIPEADLIKAAATMGVMFAAITAVVTVLGLLTGLVGGIAGLLGGGAAGFFAIPALMLAMAAAFLSLGAAMLMGASAMQSLAGCLTILYNGLALLATLDIPSIALGLTELALSCGALAVGLIAFGTGATFGSIGFGLLGAALLVFDVGAQMAVPLIQQLAELDLASIGSGFSEMGKAGIVMIAGAVGLVAYAAGLRLLTAAIQSYAAVKDVLKNFSNDVGTALTQGAARTSILAKAAGLLTGKGWETGFRQGAQWHSPPAFLKQFAADCGYTLSDNWSLVKAAETAGGQVGSGWVSGFASKVQAGLSKIKGAFGDLSLSADSLGLDFGDLGGAIGDAYDNLTGFFDEIDVNNFLPEELTQTLEEGTGGFGDFGEAAEEAGEKTGKAGKQIKDTLSSLKDTIAGMDIFSKFEAKTEMSAQDMLDNMKSNLDGVASWTHRMTVLMERGIDQGLYQKLAEMGPKSYEQVNAFINMTDEQLKQANEMYLTSLALPDKSVEIIGAGFKYAGEMATQGFSNALDAHNAEHAAAQMGKAAVDGISKELEIKSPSKKFYEKGKYCTEGFRQGLMDPAQLTFITDCIHLLCNQILTAFDEEFSDEKFKEVGSKTLKSLVENTFAEGGAMSVEGFANAFLEFSLINTNVTAFCEQIRSLMEDELDVTETSKSEVFYNYARQSVLGFASGITNNLSSVRIAITTFSVFVKAILTSEKIPDSFYEVGKNATYGFANGISDSEASSKVREEAKKVAEEAAKIMKDALGEQSPSRVTKQIGLYASKGLAIGIKDGARNVYDAAKSVADGTANSFNTYGSRIQDLIDTSLDFNPVITPLLDLSVVRSQLSELDSMFSSRAADMGYGQNGGQFTANPTQQINFTQNNYSPKALSRYEIYRDTKNQLNMMKGVVKANA